MQRIRRALRRSKVVALVGPRQVGKTTLAREFVDVDSPNYFDLEDPLSRMRLDEPMTTLKATRGLVVIDEIQLAPTLFPILRVIVDRREEFGQYLILGSASPRLLQSSGESLLGRIEVIEVAGFLQSEVGRDDLEKLWLRGGYPPAFLARTELDSLEWRKNAIHRFVEQDLNQLGIRVPAPAMLRFWTMLSHYHGQIWSAADPARSLGVSEPTVRRYLDHLTQTYMIRQLPPWFENIAKRQVKQPKIYFPDSGLLHYLLGIRESRSLHVHPKVGASWEGFALLQVLRITQPDEAYFWATHSGAELDLLLFKDGKRIGFEFKRADAPRATASMKTARDSLSLSGIFVIYPGTHRVELAEKIVALPLAEVTADLLR
jgi:predicted AAA+ superfamily ATPase